MTLRDPMVRGRRGVGELDASLRVIKMQDTHLLLSNRADVSSFGSREASGPSRYLLSRPRVELRTPRPFAPAGRIPPPAHRCDRTDPRRFLEACWSRRGRAPAVAGAGLPMLHTKRCSILLRVRTNSNSRFRIKNCAVLPRATIRMQLRTITDRNIRTDSSPCG